MKKLLILGNLTKDSEIKNINENNYITINIACNDGDTPTYFSALYKSENKKLLNYLKKGKKVYLDCNPYINNDNKLSIFVNNLELC